jgi:hypothetical protein
MSVFVRHPVISLCCSAIAGAASAAAFFGILVLDELPLARWGPLLWSVLFVGALMICTLREVRRFQRRTANRGE